MTTYIMFDSVNADAIPPAAFAVAGYSDGLYNWPLASWNRYLKAYRVPITVLGGHTGARVCDCETGDLTPLSAALWAHAEINQYGQRRPTIYCNASTVPAVSAQLTKLSLEFVRDVDLWVAKWDGAARLDFPGAVAKQYQHPPASGGNFDLSVVDPVWLGSVANPPVGLPAPVQGASDPVTTANVNGVQVTVDAATVAHLKLTGRL